MIIEGTTLHIGDIIVIVAYFIFVLTVGLWTSRKNRGTVGGYFLAGRQMNWIPLGASLFASNVGSLHFVGLAGSGAEAGIGIAVYELNAIFIVLLLGWFFVPVYLTSGVFTTPEYLRERFGGQRIRIYLAVLSLLMYIFTKISADLFAGAIFIEQSLKWDMYGAIILLLAIAAIFTITGGLTAVIWTDFIQTIIMMIGATALTIISFARVGGYDMMVHKYRTAVSNTTFNTNTTCGYPRKDYMNLFRHPITSDIPWPGIIGLTINSIWYWCADQVIVQRALSGKSYTHSKAGTILAGYLKILPLFLLVFPGMIARILFPNEVACVDPDVCERVCQSRMGCSNVAYPMMVMNLLPAGLRGLLLAVMLSALMSSLTSIFNSSSTVFTMDIWRKIRSKASETELMIVGRVCVLVIVIISILWVPIIKANQGSQLFVYIQQVSSFLQPPICAVYLLALFWARINEQGAFWGLMVGLVAGMTRFILEFSFPAPTCFSGLPDNRPSIIKNFHYLYFAIFLFVLTALVTIVISILTKPIDPKHLHRLTFWTRYSKEKRIPIWSVEKEEKEGDAVEEEKKDGNAIKEEKKEASNSPEELEVEVKQSELPWYKKVAYWVCGIEKLGTTMTTEEEENMIQENAKDALDESPRWQFICTANAIVLMTIAAFFWGFYA